jgi:hypothetical protein
MVVVCMFIAGVPAARADGPRADDGTWELGFGAESETSRSGRGGMWFSAGRRLGRFAIDAETLLGYTGPFGQGANDERLFLAVRVRALRVASDWSVGHRDPTLSRTELDVSLVVAAGGERFAQDAMPTPITPAASAALEVAWGFHWIAGAPGHPNDGHVVFSVGPLVTSAEAATVVTMGMRFGL